MVCTVNCVCMLTLVHGSCTSSLQWWWLCPRPSAVSPGEGKWEIQEKAPIHLKIKILCFVSFLSCPCLSLILSVSSHSSSCCYSIIQALHKSFSSLIFAMSQSLSFSLYGRLFSMPAVNVYHLNLKWFVAQYVCCCTEPSSDGATERGPLYTLCSAILGSNIQWLQLRNKWPLLGSSHCTDTCPLTLQSPLCHKNFDNHNVLFESWNIFPDKHLNNLNVARTGRLHLKCMFAGCFELFNHFEVLWPFIYVNFLWIVSL